MQIAHLPYYPPVSMLGVDFGSAHRESELGASIGQSEDAGFGVVTMLRIYCASVIWTLEPGDFTAGGVVRLSGWSKNCIESISAYPFNIYFMKYHLKRENERTIAGRTLRLVSDDSGDRARGIFSNECGTTRIGGERVGHGLVVPCVLQASNDLNGDVEAPRERHVPVRMTAGDIDLAEDAIGDQPGYRFVVGCKEDVRLAAARNRFG